MTSHSHGIASFLSLLAMSSSFSPLLLRDTSDWHHTFATPGSELLLGRGLHNIAADIAIVSRSHLRIVANEDGSVTFTAVRHTQQHTHATENNKAARTIAWTSYVDVG